MIDKEKERLIEKVEAEEKRIKQDRANATGSGRHRKRLFHTKAAR